MALFVFEADCPECKKSLVDTLQLINDHPSIRLKVKCKSGEGLYRLSAVYESKECSSRLKIDHKEKLTFCCPYCGNDLTSTKVCELCKAKMIYLLHHMGGKLVFCPKKSCSNHFVNFEDTNSALFHLYGKYPF
jgi:hypothetical protein